MPKHIEMHSIKFNCSNANAAIRGDYYFLSIYIARNEIYTYTKIVAVFVAFSHKDLTHLLMNNSTI
jgi:hypothetical protein